MKLHNIFIYENQNDTKTKTKSKVNMDWDSLFGDDPQLPAQSNKNPDTKEPNADTKAPSKDAMRTVGRDRTKQRMSNVTMTSDIADKLGSIDYDQQDEIDDDQARINATTDDLEYKPKPPGTDLVQRADTKSIETISTAVTNRTGVVPEWHQVKNLPGYLQSAIRSIGRAVFAPFTSTPIEKIQVIANIGDNGPNDKAEIDAVIQFLTQHGERDSDAELEFQERIPGYAAQLKVFKAMGYTFVAVADFAGGYIYSWPTKSGDGLAGNLRQRRIGGDAPPQPVSASRRLR